MKLTFTLYDDNGNQLIKGKYLNLNKAMSKINMIRDKKTRGINRENLELFKTAFFGKV